MVNSPVEIAHPLFACGFINEQTHRDVLTEGTTNDSKAYKLTQHSIRYITIHSEPADKLNELLEILEEVEPAASVVAKKIRQVRTAHALHTPMQHTQHTHTHTHTHNTCMHSLSLSLSLSLTLVAGQALWGKICFATSQRYDSIPVIMNMFS